MTEGELVFKIILIVEFSAFSIIRILYQILAKRAGYRTVIQESKKYSIFLSLLICYEVVTLFIYLLHPEAFSWATIKLAVPLRWMGALLGGMSLSLFVWLHHNLGSNFSASLRIADKQTLVESGPYFWIRHPMYTAFFILHLATFLLTANYFIGLTWTLGLCIIIAIRVKREEAMLVGRFGEQYLAYSRRTGKFLPLIKAEHFMRKRTD